VRVVLVAIAFGCLACHASLSSAPDGGGVHADAPPDVGIPIDAPKVCAGGDGHTSDTTGNCFILFLSPKTWVAANTACMAVPAKLAKITSAAQNTLVAALTHGHATFIGATDTATEGTFLWTDGSALSYNNFRLGVPDNGGGTYQEDCLVIEGNKTPDDTWDDRPCDPSEVPTSGSFAYLCEY
jgi:hypothetical protein